MTRYFSETYSQLSQGSPIKRLLAMIYDSLILMALWMLVGFVGVAVNGGEAIEGPFFRSALFLATFAFFGFFWVKSGQTLGMMAWRLRVQTPEGEKLTAQQALIRFFAAGLSWLALGLGFLWMFIHPRKLAWHDLISGTCVVQLPKK